MTIWADSPGTPCKTGMPIPIHSNNFDGIDLDFENFAFIDPNTTWDTTRIRWAAFIKTLAASLHANKKLLSMTTPVAFDPSTGKKGYYVYAWQDVANDIDRLRIMTYDYSTSAPGPIGPITWVEQAVQWAVKVMPASKVFIGLPGYGRDWIDSVSGTCPVEVQGTITTKTKAATFVMRDAANLAASYGATPVYKDKEGEVTFTYSKIFTGQNAAGVPTTCTAQRVAWYQDSRSYVERAKLVAKYRLGGIVLWTMGMEDATTMPAVRAFAQTIAPDIVISNLALDKKSAQFGEVVNISTLFSLPDMQPISNLPIRIERKNSDGSWRKIYEGLTDSNGKVSVSALLGNSSVLRATSESSWERLASQSAEYSATIAPIIEFSAPLIVRAGKPIVLRGSLQPRINNISLVVEKLVNGVWQKVPLKNTYASDLDGSFSIALTEVNEGFATYRVRWVATATLESGLSSSVTIVIQ